LYLANILLANLHFIHIQNKYQQGWVDAGSDI
jgi:hypothetical protein